MVRHSHVPRRDGDARLLQRAADRPEPPRGSRIIAMRTKVEMLCSRTIRTARRHGVVIVGDERLRVIARQQPLSSP